MTYDEVMDIVRAAPHDEWVRDEDKGISVLRADVDIRIEDDRDEEGDHAGMNSFDEEWTRCHPDAHARRAFFCVYYRASLVHRFMLVSVDGGRALLPLPDVHNKKIISQEDYNLARTVSPVGSLDEYIQRSGLTVE